MKQVIILLMTVMGTLQLHAQDQNFWIFLCFGQSNMAGQAPIEEQDLNVSDRYLSMATSDGADRKLGTWRKAVPPLCRTDAHLGPADWFGRTLIDVVPENVRIGIVSVAVEGCPITFFDKDQNAPLIAKEERDWMNGILDQYGRDPYERLLSMAKLASKDGVIKGILLHQGETDAYNDLWRKTLRKIYRDLQQELQFDSTAVPLLVGEVVRSEYGGVCAHANPTINDIANHYPNTYVVSSEGCMPSDDNVHFSSEGYRMLGRHYALRYLEATNPQLAKVCRRKLASVFQKANGKATASVDLTKATIVYHENDAPLVKHMAQVLADDIERVSGTRPSISTRKVSGPAITIGTLAKTGRHRELRGTWERYAIDTNDGSIYITGSDARGLAYGVLHVSEAIGVSPWYWFADIPIDKTSKRVYNYMENYVSPSPSVKYRGIFINDEDWGLKTWAAQTFEKELGDIGPKTYDRVCELILRLKGNMLAPAMHSCTGAFYSHPESQKMADKWGIMITTSHCEPLLFNNAALSEWDKSVDGEWNYETNSATIMKKLDNRIRETAQYDNIYTMGLRGLHDEAMKGSTDPTDRARTLEKVFASQRNILEKYKHKKANTIQQIFVPYKETLDIYDAGLRVPDDITLVWPDDNYGYMKRVSNLAEQRRSGHSGVYYHISYLGTPHDNLWIATTAPMLMYEELLKAYTAGADRYWLLNVGDIKPMEVEMQMFMAMAYDFKAFSYDNVNRYQAKWLAKEFGEKHLPAFQFILDNYYRLAWDRKPEFMGYEIEWDNKENSRLHDTDFSFQTGTAQKRLTDYQDICFAYDAIERELSAELRPALFEMLGYAVHSAYQMNRKFLYAQANHETGNVMYAEQSKDACREIDKLLERYNTQLNCKWNQMISEVPPGYTARYQQMPEYVDKPTSSYRLPDSQQHPEYRHQINLASLNVSEPFRLLDGIGTDWKALQMGQPLDLQATGSIDIALPALPKNADSISLCISVVPMWPVATNRSNRFSVSVDHGKAQVCENLFKEWGDEWKIQVLENRKEFVLTLPLDASRHDHVITLSIVDPGQIIQKITYQ